MEILENWPGSKYNTLTEFILKNACYTFCWQVYCEPNLKDENAEKKIGKTLLNEEKLKKLKEEKILHIHNYFKNYDDLIQNENYIRLNEKYLNAEISNVKSYLNISLFQSLFFYIIYLKREIFI